MPFFDDSGPRPEEEKNPLWRSFALVADQLERLILLNLLWAAQIIPLLVALVFEQIPPWLRLLLSLYTAFALAPATATLFAATAEVSEGVPLDGAMLWHHFKAQVSPAFLKLLPLLSLFYWTGWLASYAAREGWLLLDTAARLLFLFLLVFSLYWGPLLVYEPDLQAWGIFYQSVRRFWQRPGPTLLMGLACLLALALGIVSIAGFMLIVPALIAVFQIQLYHWRTSSKD
jgi:hypothetical protein